jgi:cyclopropane fatty-acyl-phospholipid synthase-like methyltransferase
MNTSSTRTVRGRLHRVLLACVVLVGAAGCLYPGAEVPYVQTPTDVVTEMLRLATVGPNDVVYDLGSGDGRFVIAAARDFGARGVGIEIDPSLVALSTEAARRAGVGDRVTFRSDDFFEADLADATVVTLYLSRSINQRLRPKLLRELRPGARIVSHNFDMGDDWMPNETKQVLSRDRLVLVFLWVIPPKS